MKRLLCDVAILVVVIYSSVSEGSAQVMHLAVNQTTTTTGRPPHPCDSLPCSHLCDVNDDGGAFCACPPGMELGVDKVTCKDKVISCPKGYQPSANGQACVDIDECLIQPPVCGHSCHNTQGSYKCLCPTGYKLHRNGVNCVDINECRVNNGGCSDTCYNTPGSYQCQCPRGYQLSAGGKICERKYSCIQFGCEHKCHQTEIWYAPYCSCNTGYKLAPDQKHCVDMNECEFFHKCDTSSGARCVNAIGSYRCECPSPNQKLTADGYSCEYINRITCATKGCSHTCDDTNYPPVCTCPYGYRLDSNGLNCIDIDECAEFTHGCSDTCINTPGHYRCECPSGKRLSNDLKTCFSINVINCAPPTLFRGSVNCTSSTYGPGTVCTRQCRTGFELSGQPSIRCEENGMWTPDTPAQCTDIDECVDNNGGCEQDCFNYLGSFSCACRSGFLLRSDRKACKDAQIPEFTSCPSNIEVNATQTSYATVTWPEVTYTDNVGVVNVTGPSSNVQNFSIGVHQIDIKIFDAEGNSALCSFKVLVRDTALPTVTNCPDDIDRVVLEGVFVKKITFPVPSFSDNSGQVTVTDNIPGDNLFPIGEYNVRYMAVDPSGNIAVCAFLVNLTKVSCPDLREPANGAIVCDTSAITPFCQAKCNEGFAFITPPSDKYVCGADGSWFPTDSVPDCQRTFQPTAVKAKFTARYGHVCTDPASFTQNLVQIYNTQHFPSLQFVCVTKPCTFTEPVITCGESEFTVTFYSEEDLSSLSDLDQYRTQILAEIQKRRLDVFFLTVMIPTTPQFFFPPIMDVENRKLLVEFELTCAAGQVEMNNKCVECPPGSTECSLEQPGLA